jgi:glycolate oxidase FAD binding subunit
VQERAPDWWGRLPGGRGTAVLKLTAEIAAVPRLLAAIDECCVAASVRGSAGVGVLYAAPQDDAAAAVRALRSRSGEWGGDVVVVDGPPGFKAAVDVWGPVRGLNLMRRIKEQFDPERRLAPGRFVGGI